MVIEAVVAANSAPLLVLISRLIESDPRIVINAFIVAYDRISDEFIKREHAEHLARTIPGASFLLLEGVSHFAPWQHPAGFNAAVFLFLARIAVQDERHIASNGSDSVLKR